MSGCVGADNRGDYLLAQLDAAGVDRTHVSRGNAATGTAVITIDPTDVSIIVIAGANGELGAKDAERAASAIADADVLLLQGEVGVEAARAAAVLAAACEPDASTAVCREPLHDISRRCGVVAGVDDDPLRAIKSCRWTTPETLRGWQS